MRKVLLTAVSILVSGLALFLRAEPAKDEAIKVRLKLLDEQTGKEEADDY